MSTSVQLGRPTFGTSLLATTVAVLAALIVATGAAASDWGDVAAPPGAAVGVTVGDCPLAPVSDTVRDQPPCEEQVAQQLVIRAAWEWVLCWDEGAACEAQIARQLPVWEAWAWTRCAGQAAGAAP